LKWAEENAESEHYLLILLEMKKRAEKAEEANIKQSKITDFLTIYVVRPLDAKNIALGRRRMEKTE
jgi:hypothetical protein